MSSNSLGQLLKKSGVIDDDVLRYALKISKAAGKRVGETLQSLGFASDREIAQAIASQASLEFTDLNETTSRDVLRLVPFNFAQKHVVLPLELREGRLVLATDDPGNASLPSLLARFVSHPLQLVVAPKALLVQEIQRRYFRAEHPLDDEIERMMQAIASGRDFPAETLVELLIASAIDGHASDMHVSPTPLATLVSLRIDGVLQLRYSLPAIAHQRLVSAVKVLSALDIADQNRAHDGRMTFGYMERKYDLRVSTMPGVYGENLVIRVLAGNSDLYSLASIGFTDDQIEQIDRLTRRSHGSILVTGPTGSGKTTSLYAMLRRIDVLRRNVLTVEDPVEIRVPMIRQMEVNEKAGVTFATAIRAFLRQDPDVILVGEVRDMDTAQLTLRASQTGHLVLSTVHTNDAVGAIVRLRDLGCQDFVLSASLNGVVAQRLVRRLCPHCRLKVELSDALRKKYPMLPETVYEHNGCERCGHTGYVGRTAVAEIIEFDSELRALVERGAMPTDIEKAVRAKGVLSLTDACLSLVGRGITDLSELERVI